MGVLGFTSGAKAPIFMSAFGTAEAVPSQNNTFDSYSAVKPCLDCRALFKVRERRLLSFSIHSFLRTLAAYFPTNVFTSATV
ncbi:MAG: hypothetical protein JWN45_3154 [Acidobacteriaceae bacterium]|nr:hypothetical protein [Acidobacteriaceae bacterium]